MNDSIRSITLSQMETYTISFDKWLEIVRTEIE